jgi:hypothetical protein
MVIILSVVVIYLIWSGSGCVSEDDMIVEKFRTPHEVIEESTLPEGTRRIDAHVVYGNGAKSEFNFSALPEETRQLINGSDLNGNLFPFIGSDYEMYTLLVVEVQFYNENSEMSIDCVEINEGRYSTMTVHGSLNLSDAEEENPRRLSYERAIIRIPGNVHSRSDFRFDVRRDGEVVTTWEEEPTLHG